MTFHTVQSLADSLGVRHHQILAWIKNGQLEAHNVGLGDSRPTWRISDDAWREFLDTRSTRSKEDRGATATS